MIFIENKNTVGRNPLFKFFFNEKNSFIVLFKYQTVAIFVSLKLFIRTKQIKVWPNNGVPLYVFRPLSYSFVFDYLVND